jgi:hypothetical protein
LNTGLWNPLSIPYQKFAGRRIDKDVGEVFFWGENKLYDFVSHELKQYMREVGRLREIAFRVAGGGTGMPPYR